MQFNWVKGLAIGHFLLIQNHYRHLSIWRRLENRSNWLNNRKHNPGQNEVNSQLITLLEQTHLPHPSHIADYFVIILYTRTQTVYEVCLYSYNTM